jgi:hypothetical protein
MSLELPQILELLIKVTLSLGRSLAPASMCVYWSYQLNWPCLWAVVYLPQVCVYTGVIHKVTLSLGPSLTLQSLFHPQLEGSGKVSETGYCLVKLGMSPQDLQDLILTRLSWFYVAILLFWVTFDFRPSFCKTRAQYPQFSVLYL